MRCDPIDEAGLPDLIQRIRQGYIFQKVTQGGWSADDAESAADEELAQLFPGGRLLPGHEAYLLHAGTASGADPVGHLWIGVLRQMAETLYVFDLEIREEARGGGLGRQAMTFAEDRARALGCASVALHVFGGNSAAIGLYSGLGYQVTDLTMKKDLYA